MGARYVWINVLVGGLFAVAVDAERRLISISTSLTSASISVTSCGVMSGNRCDILDRTASIEARTVRNTPPHSASTSAASTSDPRRLLPRPFVPQSR
jgi:hypothetical protein